MKKKLKCFVCHKEINEEEDYVFKGQTVHKGECLKSMIDEYNAVRNLQIRNKRLCVEIERLNNIINELSKENQELKEKTKLFHKNGVFSLEYDKETLRDMVLEYQEEIERLNNIINEALGIANERFNYYSNHKNNNQEHLEDWGNIFNILLRRDDK